MRLGYALLEAGEVARAIDVFERNAQRFPGSADAWTCVGDARLLAGDTNGAIAAFEAARELDPRNGYARDILDRMRREMRGSGAAGSAFRDARAEGAARTDPPSDTR